MRLSLSLITFLLLMSGFATAQISNIVGQVVDENNEPLQGAYVLLYQNEEQIGGEVTNEAGNFSIRVAQDQRYNVKVSFLGYVTVEKSIRTSLPFNSLGAIQLEKSSVELREVEVKENVITAQQQQDTLVFNADAFKTLPDADAQELLEKMPTVTVQDGKIQAQGEDVQRVTVDGRPFFGNDPTAALRNLPAEVVDKIQIFDQQSDQAQFTGFDDGETTKTVNIITRLNMRNGQFGKVYAGAGSEIDRSDASFRYQSGGNINFFDGDRRISLIGLSNNINQQNFATEDLLGVIGGGRRGGGPGGRRGRGGGPGGGRGGRGGGDVSQFLVNQSGGISQTHAIGLNYSDKWGEKFEITGSYFFNQSENETIQDLNQIFTDNAEFAELYTEENESLADNINHRANFRIEYEIDESNSIILRPSISFQQNEGRESTLGQTILGDEPWNKNESDFFSDLSALNFSNNLLYRHRFNKNRRTLSVNFNTTYNQQDGNSFLNAFYELFNENPESELTDQNALLDSKGWNLGSNIAYTEPIGARSQLMFNYRLGRRWDDSDKETFDLQEPNGTYSLLNEELSNVFENVYTTHQGGIGYNHRVGRTTTIMGRATLQHARLENEQTFPNMLIGEQTFTNVLPMLMVRHNFSRQQNIRLMYRTSTNEPSISQLQNVIDNSNPLQLSIGNPDLKQAYQHRFFIRYAKTNVEKSTIFFTLLGGSVANNYIANGTYLASSNNPIFDELDLDRSAQLSRPTNLDGYYNLRSFTTFGLPIKRLKSNLNVNVTGSYVRTPGLINEEVNYANTTTLGLGLVLSSNISESVDFTISSRSSQNIVENSLQTNQNANFFNQQSSIKFNWIIGPGIVLRNNVTHQYYDGLSEEFDQNFILWTASIGKKVFKKDRGEIALKVFDILGQNNSINRQVTETFIQDIQTNILQRYAMLTFTYNVRHFVAKK